MSERLIEADELKKNLPVDYASVLDAIDNAPTVDAVRVVHGKWTKKHDDWQRGRLVTVCSACGYDCTDDDPRETNYCSFGEKMDGEKGESK
jgi:hypothetical protein